MDINNGIDLQEANTSSIPIDTIGGWTSGMFEGVKPTPSSFATAAANSLKDIVKPTAYQSLTEINRPKIVGLDSVVKDPSKLEKARNKDKNYLGYTLGDDAFNYKGESKFKEYLPTQLYDTEDMNYQNQGFWERAGKATASFVGKTWINFLNNTGGLGAGIADATRTGNFSAVFNNEFTRQFDKDLKYIEEDLPIYAQKEYEDMSWVEKLTKGTFYFKDVPSLMAFTSGAILAGKLPMGMVGKAANLVTKGVMNARFASLVGKGMIGGATTETLATAASRKAGLKALLKSFFKSGDDVVSSITNMSDDAVRTALGLSDDAVMSASQARNILLQTYKSGVTASRIANLTGQIGVNLVMSSNEGGFEMRDAFGNMLGNYVREFEEANGRLPTDEEIIPFLKDAQDAANKVYAANLPILMVSNLFTVGKFLGFEAPSIGGLLTRGSVRTAANGALSFTKHNIARKIASNVLSYVEGGVAEGIWEEGGQYLVSEWMSEHLASKYDPKNLREQLSWGDAFYKALDKTLNSKEGQENMGVGFLFGVFMGQAGRFAQKQGSFGQRLGAIVGNDYRDTRAQMKEVVEAYNKQSESSMHNVMTPQNLMLFRRMNGLSAQMSASEDSVRQRDLSQLAQQSLLRDVGMEDIAVESFNAQVDAIANEEIEKLGVPSNRVEEYREFVKKQFADQYELNKEALDVAETFGNRVFSKKEKEALQEMGLSTSDYRMALASELVMGDKALHNVVQLSKMLAQHLSVENGGNETLNALFQDLTNRKDRNMIRLSEVTKRLKEISSEEERLQNVLVNERGRTSTNEKDISKNAEKKNIKINEILDELKNLEEERIRLSKETGDLKVKILNFLNQRQQTAFDKFLYRDNDGNGAVASEQDLDSYLSNEEAVKDRVRLVKEEILNPNTSKERREELKEWLEELKTIRDMITDNITYTKVLNQNFRLRLDGRYAFDEAKKFTSKTHFLGRKLADEELQALNEEEKEKWKELEEVIKKYELKGYDAWNLRANFRILSNLSKLDYEKAANTRLEASKDYISDILKEKYLKGEIPSSEFFRHIANRIDEQGVDSLSDFLRDIYSKHKNIIDSLVDKLKLEEGDSLSYGFSNGQQTNTEIRRDKPFLEALKEVIDSFIATNNRLSRDIVSNVEKPTKEDYERFRDLHKKKTGRDEKGKMTDKKTREKLMQEFAENEDEYEALKEKINNWGVVSGTIANGVRLSDLIELYEELSAEEQQTPQNRVTQTEVSLDDLLSESESEAEWQGNKKGRRFDVAQVYDLAMVSKDKDGNFVLHHYGVDNLIEDVQQQYPNSNIRVVGVEHISGNKPLYQSDKISTYSAVEFQIENEDGSITEFEVKIDAQNNLVFPEDVTQHLGSLRLMQIPSISRNYQPLYRENEDGTFEQVRSSFSGGIDTQATKEVRKGDVLNAEIDLNDPYTKSLVDRYKKALAEAKGDKRNAEVKEAKKALEDKMVIQLVDNKGRVVSVMKSNANSQDLQESATAPVMIKYRKNAVAEVVKAISENSDVQLVRLGKKGSVSVENVMLGVPNVRVSRNEDGDVVVVSKTLSEQDKGKIVDVGYMLDGHIHSKNGTTITAGHNLLNQYKKDKHKGNRIPLVFIRENGQVVAYPAHLQSKGNLEEQFDEIVANNDPTQAAIKLNKLMYDNGISTQLFGLTPNMIVENSPEFQSARQQAANHNLYSNPEMWVTDDVSIEDALNQDIEVNLDMQGDAFAAPKLQINYGNSNDVVNEDDVELDDKSGTTADNLSPLPSNPNSQVENKGRKTHKDKDGNVYEDYYKVVNKTFTFKGKNYKVVRSIIDGDKSLLMLLDTESGEVITEADIMKSHSMTTAVNKWVRDNVGKKEPSPIITMGESIPVNKKAEKVEDKPITTEVEQPSVEEELEKELQDEDNRKAIDEIITPYDENTEYNEENPDYIDVERKVSDLMGDSFDEWVEKERVNNRERELKPFREEIDKFFEGNSKNVDTYTDERFQDSDSFLVLEKKGKKITVQFNFLGKRSRINKEGTFNTEKEVRAFLEDIFNNSFGDYEINVGLSTLQNKFNELSAENKIQKINYDDISEVDKPTEMLSQVVEKRNKC